MTRGLWRRHAACLAFLTGCGTTQATHHDGLAARFAAPSAVEARSLAGDLFARAQQAAKRAQATADPARRTHLSQRAELWLQAAEAEADRVKAERERAAASAALERERQALVGLRKAVAAQDARAREQAERAAHLRRVQQAHARADLWQGAVRTAPDLATGQTVSITEARRSLARVLLERAAVWRALLRLSKPPADVDATLISQLHGAATSQAARAETLIAKAPQRGFGLPALRAAEASLSTAELAIGQLRRARDREPTGPEVCALLEEARLRSLRVDTGTAGIESASPGTAGAAGTGRGIAVELPALDDPNRERLRTRHLQAMLRLFPRGGVSLVLSEGTSAAGRARARQRARRTAQGLQRWRPLASAAIRAAGGAPRTALPARVSSQRVSADSDTESRLRLHFEAYRLPKGAPCVGGRPLETLPAQPGSEPQRQRTAG